MKHFEITFSELHMILGCAELTLDRWKSIIADENEPDKELMEKITELRKFILNSPCSFFKIVEDEPF